MTSVISRILNFVMEFRIRNLASSGRRRRMKQLIGLLLLTFTVQLMLANNDYPLTIKVLSTQNAENTNGTFSSAKLGGNAGAGSSDAGSSDKVAEHVMAEGSDGNTYELAPENPKDMLLPGTFQAKIEKRDMRVCEQKDKGKCRDMKFKIVAAQPTPAKQTDCTNQVVCTVLQINLSTKAAASAK
jgi:hypothetical protein